MKTEFDHSVKTGTIYRVRLEYKQARDEGGCVYNFVNSSINGLGPEYVIGTRVILEYRKIGNMGLWFASMAQEVGAAE